MKITRNLILYLNIFLGIVLCTTSCTTTNDPINNTVKTAGTLAVTASTTTYNGSYAPAHVLAIWVESSSGTFIKSLLVNANIRKQYLTKWFSATSIGNSTDAITGATLNSHGSKSCNWNGKDINGNVVGDGVYKLCIEFTENNNTGKYASFTFTKGSEVDIQTPAAVSGISVGTLKWTPN